MPKFRFAVIPLLSGLVLLPGLALAQGTNVAPTGTPTQSSLGWGGVPTRAIDGNINGTYNNNSITHTQSTAGAFWELTLPQLELVHEIHVWNRADCCHDRLANFKVIASLNNIVMSTQNYPGIAPKGGAVYFDLAGGVVCDKVRVELNGTNYLSLAEVELWRFDAPIMNLAPLGTATQSGTISGGVASRAIDRNRDGHSPNNSVSHTPVTGNNWWQVDLPWLETIHQLRIYNRGDTAGNRLSNFRVSILVGAAEVFGKDYFVTTGSVPQGEALVIDLPSGTQGTGVKITSLGINRNGDRGISLAEVEALRFGASLTPDVLEISTTTGSVQKLAIDGGRTVAGQTYLLLGSVTGTSPGLTLSGVTVPLALDPYFYWTLENPTLPPLTNPRGILDAAGRASGAFTVPVSVPSLTGLTLYHAFAVLGNTKLLDAASNAAPVTLR